VDKGTAQNRHKKILPENSGEAERRGLNEKVHVFIITRKYEQQMKQA
jgi:hypothetical protein